MNVKDDVYKNGHRRRSCTCKTATKSPFRQICNVLLHHYTASSILLTTEHVDYKLRGEWAVSSV